MRLTKHGHAFVEVESGAGAVLIDPGVFTPGAADLLARAAAVLVTHEHFDHVDAEALDRAPAARPELSVLSAVPLTVLAAGESVEV